MPGYQIEDLLTIMRKLRHPADGCPWDIEQTFDTIAPYTIEEAYEVGEAITERDMDALKGELGDLLFQVVFHAQMAAEEGAFSFSDVVEAVCEKMLSRHPHVFAGATIEDADAQTVAWEDHKRREREAKAAETGRLPSILDGVALGYPALMRATKLSKRAARVGFDWTTPEQVLEKVAEEVAELDAEIAKGADNKEAIEAELGDILFVYTNLARAYGVDAERGLRGTNRRFEQRFHRMEEILAGTGERLEDKTLDELEALWQRAKQELRDDPETTGRA